MLQHLLHFVSTIAQATHAWSDKASRSSLAPPQQTPQHEATAAQLLSAAIGSTMSWCGAAAEPLLTAGALRCLHALASCALPLRLDTQPQALLEVTLVAMAGAHVAAAAAGGVAALSPCDSSEAGPASAGASHIGNAALMVQAYGLAFLGQACKQGWLQGNPVPSGLLPAVHSAVGMVASFLEQHQAAGRNLTIVACPAGGDALSPCCALAHACPGTHWRMSTADLAAAASAAAALLLWCGGPAGVNSVDASGSGVLHRLSAAGCGQVLVAYMAAAGPHLELTLRDARGADAATVARCVCRTRPVSYGIARMAQLVWFGCARSHPTHFVVPTRCRD